MWRPRWHEVEGLVKLASVVALWDVFRGSRGRPTFSAQVAAQLLVRRRRCFLIALWAILTHHLFCGLFPAWCRRTWRMPRAQA